MKSKKDIYGYDRLDLSIAYSEYKIAVRLMNAAIVAMIVGLGILAYNII